MNNKTKTYLLLAAVLGIWGTISYQVVSGISTNEVSEITEKFNSTFNPKPVAVKDSFSIQPVDRDPFLGTLAKRNSTPIKSKPSLVKPAIQFPSVIYNARIKKADAKTSFYIVTINNQQYKLKKGQLADSVKLVNGNAETIVLRYKNQTKTIKRQ